MLLLFFLFALLPHFFVFRSQLVSENSRDSWWFLGPRKHLGSLRRVVRPADTTEECKFMGGGRRPQPARTGGVPEFPVKQVHIFVFLWPSGKSCLSLRGLWHHDLVPEQPQLPAQLMPAVWMNQKDSGYWPGTRTSSSWPGVCLQGFLQRPATVPRK